MSSREMTTVLAEDGSAAVDSAALQHRLESLRMQQGLVQLEVDRHAASLRELLETSQGIMAQCGVLHVQIQELLAQSTSGLPSSTSSDADVMVHTPSLMQREILTKLNRVHSKQRSIEVDTATVIALEKLLYRGLCSFKIMFDRTFVILLMHLLQAKDAGIHLPTLANQTGYKTNSFKSKLSTVQDVCTVAGISLQRNQAQETVQMDCSVLFADSQMTVAITPEANTFITSVSEKFGYSKTLSLSDINPIVLHIINTLVCAKSVHTQKVPMSCMVTSKWSECDARKVCNCLSYQIKLELGVLIREDAFIFHII